MTVRVEPPAVEGVSMTVTVVRTPVFVGVVVVCCGVVVVEVGVVVGDGVLVEGGGVELGCVLVVGVRLTGVLDDEVEDMVSVAEVVELDIVNCLKTSLLGCLKPGSTYAVGTLTCEVTLLLFRVCGKERRTMLLTGCLWGGRLF
jgi:hypothetical protein